MSMSDYVHKREVLKLFDQTFILFIFENKASTFTALRIIITY